MILIVLKNYQKDTTDKKWEKKKKSQNTVLNITLL